MGYLFLAIAIIAEVIATTAMKATEGFTKPIPSILVVVGYGVAFKCLAEVLKYIPVGIAYAIWAGLGIVLTAVAAAVIYKQIPDWQAVTGMALIILGVITIQMFSSSAHLEAPPAGPAQTSPAVTDAAPEKQDG